jgi:hypothetical protein
LNLHTMSKLFSSQDTVLVWNGFPQHMLGRGGSLKLGVGDQISYPLKNDYSFYRSILEGALSTQPFRPLVCSSRIAELCSLVDVFLANSSGSEAGKIIHPVTFLNGCDGRRNTMEDLKSAQPYLLIEELKIYNFLSSNGYKVIRLSYRDGTQHGNGVILSYRGEYIIYRMSDNTYHPLRVSLQVTPETRQMRKFNSHSSIYKYLTALEKYMPGEFTSPSGKYTTATGAECFAMPKPDGSLGVAFVVKKDSIQGEVLQLMKGNDISGNYLVEVDDYLVGFGSKGCLFLNQTREYEAEFAKSINASYGSFEKLAHLVVSYLKEHFTVNETASVIFEMVPEHPHEGLTVDYGKNFTTHLGTILYDPEMETSIKIILPDEVSKKFFPGVKVTKIPCTITAITTYYERIMENALAGEIADLEGFMFAFRLSNGEILYVKVKFPWYFAAHKPDTNFEEAQKLATDPIYDIIRPRLVNLARSNCKLEARNDLEGTFRLFSTLLNEAFLKFIKNNDDITDKKSCMLKFKQNKAAFTEYSGIEVALSSALSKLDFKGKCNIESIVPLLWLNHEEKDANLRIASITKSLIGNWKIKF